MMNLIQRKTYSFLLLVISIISFAQSVPPPPDNPESGDIGAPAAPIDAYIFIMFLIATAMIAYITIKDRKRIIE